MIYTVLQPKTKTIRYVNVKEIIGRCVSGDEVYQALDHIFHYGQNDFQPRDGCPSVSVGDIAIVDGTYWVCEPIGWTNLA